MTALKSNSVIYERERRKFLKPIVKWAGGKRQLLPEIRKLIPQNITTYYEPFLGGGAVLFDLQPKRFVVNDINSELINLYECIKHEPNKLLAELTKFTNAADHFYKVRALDRMAQFGQLLPVMRAARMLYLNKTCFNGLFRVNKSGHFNVPFGNYSNPKIIIEAELNVVSQYFKTANGVFTDNDYEAALITAEKGCFVYLDPPYDYRSGKHSFTNYTKTGFNRHEQERLKSVCDKIDQRGCRFLLSNSSTPFINQAYKNYRIEVVQASRRINSNIEGRGSVNEVLIRNYD